MPYGLYTEERGWTYTESIQLVPSYLGDGATRWRWNFSIHNQNGIYTHKQFVQRKRYTLI